MSRVGLTFDVGNVRLAAAAWSRLAEPADEVAGALVASLGVSAALEWLADQTGALREPVPPALAAGVERWMPRLESVNPENDIANLELLGGRLVTPADDEWPVPLTDLGAVSPFALWVRGPANLREACTRSVALVGSRAATAYGEHVTADLAVGLADRTFTVVSGGAYGIDAAAHRAALGVGAATIAVLAGGVDRYYPAGNSALQRRIQESGALVAEMPPGSAPMRQRFLTRNRLIAALTGATVVVEAAWRSGALSTARHAAQLLRPVGAVPGPVTSMASAGCHQLLRDGVATCDTDAGEVAELAGRFGLDAADAPPEAGEPLPSEARLVLESLPARGAASVAKIAEAAGRSVPAVLSGLGILRARALVQASDGKWRRSPSSDG